MAKPLWACTNCGMSSGRQYNVERHIKSIHQGHSRVIPFTEYIVGRSNGTIDIPLYSPKAPPSYEKNEKADASNGDPITGILIKACADMYCARQRHAFPTYPSSTYHKPTNQQQPADSDKKMSASDKDPILEAAKKMVDHCTSNKVSGAAENPLNSQKTSTPYKINYKEVARKTVDDLYARMEKSAASKKP